MTCIQYALEKGGHSVPPFDELLWCIGPPLHHSFAKLVADKDEAYWYRLVDFYRERFKPTGQFENEVYPGIVDLLSRLRDTKKLFVATSKPRVFAQSIAEHFGFHTHFDRIHGSELNGERTDKAELIRFILETEGLQADETVMIGDRMHDVRGAQLNGVATIGITWGYGSRAELEEAGADLIVETVEELGRLLTRV